MNSTYQYHIVMYCRNIMFLVLICLLVVSCGTRTETGVLVGIRATFALGDLIDDQVIQDMDFEGIVVVELDDGTRVEAVCDEEIWSQLQGGQRLEIAPIKDSDYWKVVRIVD